MALEESIDGLEKLESNGIVAWIDPRVNEYITQLGDINIDYVTREFGSGYVISAGKPSGNCGTGGGCSSCT